MSVAVAPTRDGARETPRASALPAVPPTPVPTGARRPRRRAVSVAAGYLGASGDRRELADWWPGTGSPDTDTLTDRAALVARSRDLVRNDPIAAGAVSTHVTKTVGAGLAPLPRVDRRFLQLSDDAADAWEREAKSLWWAACDQLDLTRRDTMAGLQELWLRTQLQSGDVFAIRRYKARPGDLLGLKVQLIEGDRVSNPQDRPDTWQGEHRLVGGIAFDADGAPVTCHVRDTHPGERRLGLLGRSGFGPDTWRPVPWFGAATGEPLVLHGLHRERPEQTRGVPFLSPVIAQLKQLSRYTEAELMAAVVSAMFTVFVKTDGGGGLGAIDPAALVASNGGEGAPVGLTEGRDPPGQIRLDTGAIVDLNPGESIETANPNRPYPGFDAFFTAILRQVGPAIDTPFEVLIKHFTASYSASRAALLELWEAISVRRARMVRQFCQPLYVWVLGEAIARGFLDAPGFLDDPRARAAWTAAEWIGPAPGQLDEERAVRAAEGRLRIGVSTLERETAAITGGDWEETHAQQVKERRARTRDGLDIEPVAERIRTEPTRPAPPDPASAPVDPAESDDAPDAGDDPAGRAPTTDQEDA